MGTTRKTHRLDPQIVIAAQQRRGGLLNGTPHPRLITGNATLWEPAGSRVGPWTGLLGIDIDMSRLGCCVRASAALSTVTTRPQCRRRQSVSGIDMILRTPQRVQIEGSRARSWVTEINSTKAVTPKKEEKKADHPHGTTIRRHTTSAHCATAAQETVVRIAGVHSGATGIGELRVSVARRRVEEQGTQHAGLAGGQSYPLPRAAHSGMRSKPCFRSNASSIFVG